MHLVLARTAALTLLLCGACQAQDTPALAAPADAPAGRSEAFYACEGCEGALERAPAGLDWRARIAPPGRRASP